MFNLLRQKKYRAPTWRKSKFMPLVELLEVLGRPRVLVDLRLHLAHAQERSTARFQSASSSCRRASSIRGS